MWEDLQNEYGDRIELVTVDRDSEEGGAFARSHGIRYQPGFVVVNASGEVTYAGLGPWAPDDVRALVLSVLPE